ncbi:hypothetical protein Scep_019539 [Stephania cephalantha]|uniref:Uncharacterized protein n=1 Tax=Stephania cephalantha TaxID=152367 RepID=A0AAP0IBD2_9MAGN
MSTVVVSRRGSIGPATCHRAVALAARAACFASATRHRAGALANLAVEPLSIVAVQFPNGAYNPVDSYVFQPSAGMDEDDEAYDEFNSRQCCV